MNGSELRYPLFKALSAAPLKKIEMALDWPGKPTSGLGRGCLLCNVGTASKGILV